MAFDKRDRPALLGGPAGGDQLKTAVEGPALIAQLIAQLLSGLLISLPAAAQRTQRGTGSEHTGFAAGLQGQLPLMAAILQLPQAAEIGPLLHGVEALQIGGREIAAHGQGPHRRTTQQQQRSGEQHATLQLAGAVGAEEVKGCHGV